VAEGVENQEILERLRIQGCDFIQGYHLCKPLPPELFQQWLSDRLRFAGTVSPDLSASA
jgi:EAL domain-containing protein (putative c-di-GMP-specific phosphodiesterase class I)